MTDDKSRFNQQFAVPNNNHDNSHSSSTPTSVKSSSPNSPRPWESGDYRPSTVSIVEAVKSLNVYDVKWFLRQLDLSKNHGSGRKLTPVILPPTPTSPNMTSPISANCISPAASTSPPTNTDTTTGSNSTSSNASASTGVTEKPSEYLKSLPDHALQLPTSSPYILDILLDTIIGLQARAEFVEIEQVKESNEAKAKADGIDPKLVHLLTPVPPVKPPSLYLPSPTSEYAFQILESLIEAVDIVGVNSLTKQAAIDYLKTTSIPYPMSQPKDDQTNEVAWSVTPEWRRRVALLEEYGAVLDVDRPEDDTPQSAKKSKNNRSHSFTSTSTLSPSPSSFISLPPPPRPTDFIHPPFHSHDRSSQEAYLKHIYLELLEKRQLFLKLVTDVLTRVRNERAQANYQLGLTKATAEARVAKIIADIKSFEDGLSKSGSLKEDAMSQSSIDAAAAEKIERQAASVRREELQAYRDSVALRGTRIIVDHHRDEKEAMEAARQRYHQIRTQGRLNLRAVEDARQQLATVNQTFDKWALALEARMKEQDTMKERKARMQEYVTAFELAVKAGKKSLKDTMALVERSRALTASQQLVEFDVIGRGVHLLFANSSLNGVSNLFLKFYRCMSPAPDPLDPNPEVVWCPEPCAITELCSPTPNRTVAQVTNPSWRTVKIDVWKLCEAEFTR